MNDDKPAQTAAEAFQQISNELRVEILYELAQSDSPLKFSELMDALEERDSGRLNYHMDQLRGSYIVKEEDKYRLTIQGAKIISSILASRYVETDTTYSVSVDGDCCQCGASNLQLEQVGQQAIIRCTECDCKQFRKSVSTSLWKRRDPREVPKVLDQIVWSELELAVNNICEYCRSSMSASVSKNKWDWGSDLYGLYDFDLLALYECDLCTNWKIASHGLVAWLHSDVRSFHEKRGIDPDEVRCWQIEQGINEQYTTVKSRDPYKIEVRFPIDDAECRVLLDDSNEVVRVNQEWTY